MLIDKEDVQIKVSNGSLAEFRIGGTDVTKVADRANIVIESDGTTKVVLEISVGNLSLEGDIPLSSVPSVDASLFRAFLLDFLNSVDARSLESEALGNITWSNMSPTEMLLESLKEHANGIS